MGRSSALKRSAGCIFLIVSAGLAIAGPDTSEFHLPQAPSPLEGGFDLHSDEGLSNLAAAAETLVQIAEAQKRELAVRREQALAGVPLTEASLSQLRAFFRDPEDAVTRRDRRGLKEIQRLARAALETRDDQQRGRFINLIREVASAVENNQRRPVPSQIDFFEFPIKLCGHLRNPLGRGRAAATNLAVDADADADLSKVDPRPSTFWQRPKEIGDQNLYAGFGRSELPRLDDPIWAYEGPKTGFGSNPGFEVTAGGQKMKVKFGEVTSEPFTARIFHALGYHVDPTDHAEHLKIRYDRRLLREFHLRKEIKTRFTIFGVLPAYTMSLQRRFDPFDFIAWAVMKDGTRVSGRELKLRLFNKSGLRHPEDFPDNYRPEVESQIDHLVTVAANAQIEDDDVKSIGPWDFGQLGHEQLRELRGVGLLAAWLGWFDSRFENTRLKLVEAGGQKRLRHYFDDVGGGLGRGTGLFSPRGELPDEFGWTFTRVAKSASGGRGFRIVGFKPIDNTPAFSQMTIDDARWMARLIAQLREEQIVEALAASGFDSSQVKLYTEKLLSRRDRMIQDLDLSDEIALLRPNGADPALSGNRAVAKPIKESRHEARGIGVDSRRD